MVIKEEKMSGHSKFDNIKHRKEKNDAAKGKIFTMLGRELQVAVRAGGPDPLTNGKLKDLIAKCKSNNMPNDTIERSIKKASGNEDGAEYEIIRYEGYGPNGVAVIAEALTDNRNRAAANVRSAFTKGGGNMGTSGCVSFMFDEKGLIVIGREEVEMEEEDLMMLALDAGAEDFSAEEDSYEIITMPEDFPAVYKALESEKIPMASAEVTMIPQLYTELTEAEDLKKMNKLLDLLEEDDDVKNIYHNWNA